MHRYQRRRRILLAAVVGGVWGTTIFAKVHEPGPAARRGPGAALGHLGQAGQFGATTELGTHTHKEAEMAINVQPLAAKESR